MFADTKIIILNEAFRVIKEIRADVQGVSSSISLAFGVKLDISKRVFCKPDNILELPLYFKIAGMLYKPFVYKRWDSYYELYLYKLRRQNMVETIDELIDFFIIDRGEVIAINNVKAAAVIIDDSENIGEYDDKLIFCKNELKLGNLVTYDGKQQLVFFPVQHNKNSYTARVRRCNHKIAFNYAGDVQWFDAIIETQTFDIKTGQYFNLPEGKVEVWLQENEKSIRVNLEQRFIDTGRAWKVTGIDRAKSGLMRLFCELTQSNQDDNFKLEIADYYKYVHEYSISISNRQPIEIQAGSTVQLAVVVKDNGAIVTNIPPITYTSSDESILTVSNTGLITAIKSGQANVTGLLTEHTGITSVAEVQVKGEIPKVYTIEITGLSYLVNTGAVKTATANIYLGGGAVNDKAVTWTLYNEDGSATQKAKISEITATTCKIQAINGREFLNHYVVLKATLQDDSAVYTELRLKIRSLI